MAKSRALVLSLYLFFNSAVERGLAMGLGMLLSSTRTLSLSWSAVVEERRENVVVKAREGKGRVLVAVRCTARARNMVEADRGWVGLRFLEAAVRLDSLSLYIQFP